MTTRLSRARSGGWCSRTSSRRRPCRTAPRRDSSRDDHVESPSEIQDEIPGQSETAACATSEQRDQLGGNIRNRIWLSCWQQAMRRAMDDLRDLAGTRGAPTRTYVGSLGDRNRRCTPAVSHRGPSAACASELEGFQGLDHREAGFHPGCGLGCGARGRPTTSTLHQLREAASAGGSHSDAFPGAARGLPLGGHHRQAQGLSMVGHQGEWAAATATDRRGRRGWKKLHTGSRPRRGVDRRSGPVDRFRTVDDGADRGPGAIRSLAHQQTHCLEQGRVADESRPRPLPTTRSGRDRSTRQPQHPEARPDPSCAPAAEEQFGRCCHDATPAVESLADADASGTDQR